MKTFQLVATAASGLEAIVGKEVARLGYDPKVENGKVYFEGDLSAIARANLWLRVADRVKIVVGVLKQPHLMNCLKRRKLYLGKIICR